MKFSDINIYDFGHKLDISGVVYQDEDRVLIVPLPGNEYLLQDAVEVKMTQDDWAQLLRQTDLLETEILQQAADGKLTKAIIRKSTRQIELGVSWTVYHRDNYRCRYCGKGEGTPLTVDHLVTWESGGPSTIENLVTACRRCNKMRSDLPYAEWLKHPHYLRVSQGISQLVRLDNEELVGTLDKIPRRVHQRSR